MKTLFSWLVEIFFVFNTLKCMPCCIHQKSIMINNNQVECFESWSRTISRLPLWLTTWRQNRAIGFNIFNVLLLVSFYEKVKKKNEECLTRLDKCKCDTFLSSSFAFTKNKKRWDESLYIWSLLFVQQIFKLENLEK